MRTCRLCPGTPRGVDPICSQCWGAFDGSGERRRADGIQGEYEAGRITHEERDWRCNIALIDYITRVLAERTNGAVHPKGES